MKIKNNSSLPSLSCETSLPPSPSPLLLNSTQLDQLTNQLKMLSIDDESINKVLEKLKIIKNEPFSMTNKSSILSTNDFLFEFVLSQLFNCGYGHVLSTNLLKYKYKKNKKALKYLKMSSSNNNNSSTNKSNKNNFSSSTIRAFFNHENQKMKFFTKIIEKKPELLTEQFVKDIQESNKSNQNLIKNFIETEDNIEKENLAPTTSNSSQTTSSNNTNN